MFKTYTRFGKYQGVIFFVFVNRFFVWTREKAYPHGLPSIWHFKNPDEDMLSNREVGETIVVFYYDRGLGKS